MFCFHKKLIEVLKSGNNLFYLGTKDTVAGWCEPYCRCSAQYFDSFDEAKSALENKDFTMRKSLENMYCSGGECFKNGGEIL